MAIKDRASTDGVAPVFGIADVDNTASLTVTDRGNGVYHSTKIEIEDLTLITPAGAASLAAGKGIYTFPAGRVLVHSAYIDIELSTSGSTVTADTPDLGLGTTIGTGAVAVLGGTAAFENIMTGQTAADVNATATTKFLSTDLGIETGGDKTVYLNIADGWAGAEATGVQANGTVILNWILNT